MTSSTSLVKPNEIVGYRFKADWYSINVVVVKRRSAQSSKAGQEYEEVLAYCRNVEMAAQWLFDHIARAHGERNQQELAALEKLSYEVKPLVEAVGEAKAQVLAAVVELNARIEALGLAPKQLAQGLMESSKDAGDAT